MTGTDGSRRAKGAAVLLLVAVLTAGPASAQTDTAGSTYRGEYSNAFMAGRTADGRVVSVLAGVHTHFPYNDPASTYAQVAVRVDGEEPLVLTGRPRLRGMTLDLGETTARFALTSRKIDLRLELAAVRHPTRYEGDPAQFGDLFLSTGQEPEESPGLIYHPFELTGLRQGSLTLRGRRIELTALHGQAESGRFDTPNDPRFRPAFDYIAAPTLEVGAGRYTYVGFAAHALHAGADGSLDGYFRDTGSDEMTMEGGTLSEGNPHGAPAPFGNLGALPPGSRKLAQWATDLGPGILYRKLIRIRDGDQRRPLEVFSESIVEDPGTGRDAVRPRIAKARRRSGRISLRLSEPALVAIRTGDGRRVLRDGRAGKNAFRGRWRRRAVIVRATDESGNRSRRVTLPAPR